MKTGRKTYTAEAPASLIPESLIVQPIVQPLPLRGDLGSKKKCITGLWDVNIPSELLQDILSRLGLKDNIRASVVCKTWLEAAISVRKLQPRPWLFSVRESEESSVGTYCLYDPRLSQIRIRNFPALEGYGFCCSCDGWLLMVNPSWYSVFIFSPCTLLLFNPFTQEHIYLPKREPYFDTYCLAFSAAPTSTSCLVFSLIYNTVRKYIEINTWRPGETVWTTHRFENQHEGMWRKCVFSNGMFYCLSECGFLGVFDPPRAAWKILPVKPCPAFGKVGRRMFMIEHEGDIFVMFTFPDNNLSVFKLNLECNVWEEKRELGGLTIFASDLGSFGRAGLPAEERNRIYPWNMGYLGVYYRLADGKISSHASISNHFPIQPNAWVYPPHNYKC